MRTSPPSTSRASLLSASADSSASREPISRRSPAHRSPGRPTPPPSDDRPRKRPSAAIPFSDRRVQSRGAGSIGDRPVTVRVTTLKGRRCRAVLRRATCPGYYLDAGEPPGRWLGVVPPCPASSARSTTTTFLNLMDGIDPTGTVVRGRRYGDDVGARATTSRARRRSRCRCCGRVGDDRRPRRGRGGPRRRGARPWSTSSTARRPPGRCTAARSCVVDARGLTVAAFRQHTSRAGRPAAAHPRRGHRQGARRPTAGGWRSTAGRQVRPADPVGALPRRPASELTRRLGVQLAVAGERHRRDGRRSTRTCSTAFSKRTAQVEDRLEVKLDRFRDAARPEPTPRERWRLEREAVVDSRPAKPSRRATPSTPRRWRRQLDDARHRPARCSVDASATSRRRRRCPTSGHRPIVDQALAALAEQQSTWRRNELVRELARAVPTDRHRRPPASSPVARRPRRPRHRPTGSSSYARRRAAGHARRRRRAPDHRVTARPAVHHRRRSSPRKPDPRPAPSAGSPPAAARRQRRGRAASTGPSSTSPAPSPAPQQLVLVVGPAGTGKTTALRPAVAALQTPRPQRRRRSHRRRPPPRCSPRRPACAPTPSTSSSSSTATGPAPAATRRHDRHRRRGRHARHPEARRARSTSPTATLAARARRRPAAVLRRRPRRHVRPPRRHPPDRRARDRSTASPTPGNATPPSTSAPARTDVLDTYDQPRPPPRRRPPPTSTPGRPPAGGLLRPTGSDRRAVRHQRDRPPPQRRACKPHASPPASSAGTRPTAADRASALYVGDVVATRRNDRTLRTDRGAMVKNRARWTVDGHRARRRAHASPARTAPSPSPPTTSTDHVELAYAETIHAAQGRTVDRGLVRRRPHRGRASTSADPRPDVNDAFVATEPDQSARVLDEPSAARGSTRLQSSLPMHCANPRFIRPADSPCEERERRCPQRSCTDCPPLDGHEGPR